MFNKTYVVAGGTQSHYHHTTEKRAPTDESVKLLREMEQKAQDQVIKSIKVDNNLINFALDFMVTHFENEERFRCVIRVNGVTHTSDTNISSWDRLSPDDKIKRVLDDLANTIARELLYSNIDKLVNTGAFR